MSLPPGMDPLGKTSADKSNVFNLLSRRLHGVQPHLSAAHGIQSHMPSMHGADFHPHI